LLMLPRSRLLIGLLITVVAAGLLALVLAPPRPEHVFTVRGIVRAPPADGEIVIQHEEIPDFMPAMTMPFRADGEEVEGLAPGDVVEFTFTVTEEESRAAGFRKIGRAG